LEGDVKQKPIKDLVLVIVGLVLLIAFLGLYLWPSRPPHILASVSVLVLASTAIVMLFVAAQMLLRRLR